jgi:hypothetical protein
MIKESKKIPEWKLFLLLAGIILTGLFFNYKSNQNTKSKTFLIFN